MRAGARTDRAVITLLALLRRCRRTMALALALLVLAGGVLGGVHLGDDCGAGHSVAAALEADQDPGDAARDCGDCSCHLHEALADDLAMPASNGVALRRALAALALPDGLLPAVEPPPVRS